MNNLHAKRLRQNDRIGQSMGWLILILFLFIPRLLDLDVFLTPDEILFLDHARNFAAGIISGDFSQTLGIGYPGVTVAEWSAPVVYGARTDLAAYTAGRIVTVLVVGLLLAAMYKLGRLLLGRWPALLGVGLLALDPMVLAYSRLIHDEAPLTLFMTLTGLSCLLWLRQGLPDKNWANRSWRWLLLTGLFTGLALLTKSAAVLLGPMLIAVLAGWVITLRLTRSTQHILHPLLAGLISLIFVAFVAAFIFFVLWPAMWTHPAQALDLTLGKLLNDKEAGVGNSGFFWWGHFVQDPGPAFYPVAFLLKATPWLLIGLLLNVWLLITRRIPTHSRMVITPLWIFALTYLVVMTIASKKAVRYLLPAIPILYLLAGWTFYHIIKSVTRWTRLNSICRDVACNVPTNYTIFGILPARFTGLPSYIHASLLFAPLFLLLTFFYHPYYFTYYNPLVLGWRWAPQVMLVGWGEGLDEAARYLNRQPSAQVAAWYEWLFSVFYQGQTLATNRENLITADHVVLYINQAQRDIPDPNIIHYFRTRRQPEYTARMAGIDYAWVYPGPIVGFRPDPTPQYPLGGDFGGEVRLLGYDLSQPQLSGQPLIVTLYWRLLAQPPGERFVYVRLIDAQGRLWAKTDSPPVMGLWPVERWQPDSLIEDAQELLAPPGTPPGKYRLEVGWYDPTSGQTLNAGGQPLGPGGGLLLGEVELGWQSLPVSSDLPHQTDTRLAPNARLAGYDTLPSAVTAGDLIPLRLAWREAGSILDFTTTPNNSVMFEWRQDGRRVAEQIDPLPFPIEEWGHTALLLSQHDVIVSPSLTGGRYELAVTLYTGSDPADAAFLLGSIEVTSPPHRFDLPATAIAPVGPAQLDPGLTLAGYELQPADRSFDLDLYWQTKTLLTTRYKVFAQLLAADNTVVAQSDSFPAAGRRPTTGWLPGEVITDTHTLKLPNAPAPGVYRLIAGLYDPLTGQRLPVVAGKGQPIADAILVTELTLP